MSRTGRARIVRNAKARRQPVLVITSDRALTEVERAEFIEAWHRARGRLTKADRGAITRLDSAIAPLPAKRWWAP